MTLYNIVRIALWMVLIFISLIISILTKKRLVLKRGIIISSIVVLILAFIPVENAFKSFKTPEGAFRYKTGETASAIIIGKDSAVAVGVNNSDIIIKNKNSYKIDHLLFKTVAITADDATIVTIINKKGSHDYYAVVSSDVKLSNIEDENNSKFYACPFSNYSEPLYIAYIGDSYDGYQVFIDGHKYFLE